MSVTGNIVARRLCNRLFVLWLAAVGSLAALGHGELDLRIGAATREIERDTNNAPLYLRRGELHREHLDWKSAAADYDRAEQLDPKLAQVDLCRARMLADSGELNRSRAKFDGYLARVPSDGSAHVERARLLVRLGKRRAAVADFTRGLELVREPQPEFFLERAQVLIADGRKDEALRGLDDGIRKLGPIVTLQVLAVDLELARTNYGAALARLETIVAQAARKENWLARRGEIEMLAGRPAAARESFDASLAAVAALPRRLQENKPMLDLKARVNAALAGLANPPVQTNSNQLK